MEKPALFTPGETSFWDDPHISKSMLAAHLDPQSDGASRNPKTVSETVSHLLESSAVKRGGNVLDLGCGPGLYSNRLAQQGIKVTGVDISPRSIRHARETARQQGISVEYVHTNFFELDYEGVFDSVLQIYGELCVFSDDVRDRLLSIVHKALKDDGQFVFDVSTRLLRKREGLKNRWSFSEGGFWRPGRHLVLEQGFDYPDHDTWLDQYTVINEDGTVKTYRNWFHDYTLDTITEVLNRSGFEVEHYWSDLTGTGYRPDSDWIAIVARKSAGA